jgi:hypothetical protein
MFRMDTNRRVGMLAVVVVLSLGSPLAAAGWEMPARWVSSGDLLKGFTLVLNWLGVRPVSGGASKCDAGMGTPNGCAKAGGSIDPKGVTRVPVDRGSNNGLSRTGATTDGGMSIDPNGQH